jgi:hypothetical protein
MEMNGLPSADPRRLYLIARAEGVRYIVFDGQMIGLKEARAAEQLLSPLLIGSDKFLFVSPEGWRTYEPAPGLRLRLLYKDPTSVGAVVYEVMP